MGYKQIKCCSKKYIIEKDSFADRWGEYVYDAMYECMEIIGRQHDQQRVN